MESNINRSWNHFADRDWNNQILSVALFYGEKYSTTCRKQLRVTLFNIKYTYHQVLLIA